MPRPFHYKLDFTFVYKMKSEEPLRHPGRRSIRLRGYDYSEPGVYFVTICTHSNRLRLARVVNGESRLNALGEIVSGSWIALLNRFPSIRLDSFVVMPNHFHGIILIYARDRRQQRGGASPAPTTPSPSLGQIVGAFKSVSAIAINRILKRKWTPVWQRNYYEHIIKRGTDLKQIQRYIAENPDNWSRDPGNPKAIKPARVSTWASN